MNRKKTEALGAALAVNTDLGSYRGPQFPPHLDGEVQQRLQQRVAIDLVRAEASIAQSQGFNDKWKKAAKEAKTLALKENQKWRVLYHGLPTMFSECTTCEVQHYRRHDFNCADHPDEKVCVAVCTACNQKHRYPNMEENFLDRRCADNIFEGDEVRGVFCSTCRVMIWLVPGYPLACSVCQRVLYYNKGRNRFSFKRPKKAIAVVQCSDEMGEGGAAPPVAGVVRGAEHMDEADFDHRPAKRQCINHADSSSGFEGSPMDASSEVSSWHFNVDAPVPTASGGPAAAATTTDTTADASPPRMSMVQAVPELDWDTSCDMLVAHCHHVMTAFGVEDADEVTGWVRVMIQTAIPRGPVVRGHRDLAGVRGGGSSGDEVSLRKAVDFLAEALRLRALMETAQCQEDMDGSVEEDLDREISSLLEKLPLIIVDDGFGGVTATCTKKVKGETVWRRGNPWSPVTLVRGDDWLGMSVENNGTRPVVAHCIDQHGKNKAVLELSDKKFMELEAGKSACNAATTIQEANLRWVSDAVGQVTNHVGVFWRYDDEEGRKVMQWNCILLDYKVVV